MNTEKTVSLSYALITGIFTGFYGSLVIITAWWQIGEQITSIQFPLACFLLGISLGIYIFTQFGDSSKSISYCVTWAILVAVLLPFGIYLHGYLVIRKINVFTTHLVSAVVLIPMGVLLGCCEGIFFQEKERGGKHFYLIFIGHALGILVYNLVYWLVHPLSLAFLSGILLLFLLFLNMFRLDINPYFLAILLLFHLTSFYFMPQVKESMELLPLSEENKLVASVSTRLGILRKYSNDNSTFTTLNTSPFYWSRLNHIEMEAYSHLPMLAASSIGKVTNVLVIGHGSGLILKELFKYPVANIDYYDSFSIIKNKFTPPLPELFDFPHDTRLSFKVGDPWGLFLENTRRYDLILLLPLPYELPGESKFFTLEGFYMIYQHLTPQGVLACYPYSMLTMSRTMKLNAMLLRSLSRIFPHIRIITPFRPIRTSPGEYHVNKCLPLKEIVLSSRNPSIEKIEPVNLKNIMAKENISTTYITNIYIESVFALADISGEITYDEIDFTRIVSPTLDARRCPWESYQSSLPTKLPINFVEFGVSKTTGKLEARVHLRNKDILTRRKEVD